MGRTKPTRWRLRSTPHTGLHHISLQEHERRKSPAERRRRRKTQPPVENRCVHPPEIHHRLEIAILKVGQAGIGAEQAGLDRLPGQKYRPRSAVIRAA